jgi:beta-glucosidase
MALQDFARITLQPGETRAVTFRLSQDQLAFWSQDMRRLVEPGRFDVMIGTSSSDIRLRGGFTVG